jgi:16S rRNA (cytidine1402-2'-O)-methyltransferase
VTGGTLHLVPTPLGAGAVDEVLPAAARERVRGISRFIVEEPKQARSFLKRIGHPQPLASLAIDRLPERPDRAALDRLLAPLAAGAEAALLADAGAPAVADPGALLVRRAHELAIRVAPLVGPSAILLALMASGLEGQRFAFHGYLPVAEGALAARLKALEADSRRERRTEIFIETPYRNDRLLRVIAAACAPATLLSIAIDLTSPAERIDTRTVAAWRRSQPAIGKRPAVFLLLAAGG